MDEHNPKGLSSLAIEEYKGYRLLLKSELFQEGDSIGQFPTIDGLEAYNFTTGKWEVKRLSGISAYVTYRTLLTVDLLFAVRARYGVSRRYSPFDDTMKFHKGFV